MLKLDILSSFIIFLSVASLSHAKQDLDYKIESAWRKAVYEEDTQALSKLFKSKTDPYLQGAVYSAIDSHKNKALQKLVDLGANLSALESKDVSFLRRSIDNLQRHDFEKSMMTVRILVEARNSPYFVKVDENRTFNFFTAFLREVSWLDRSADDTIYAKIDRKSAKKLARSVWQKSLKKSQKNDIFAPSSQSSLSAFSEVLRVPNKDYLTDLNDVHRITETQLENTVKAISGNYGELRDVDPFQISYTLRLLGKSDITFGSDSLFCACLSLVKPESASLLIKEFLDQKVNVNVSCKDELVSPLFIGVSRFNKDSIDLLVASGGDVKVQHDGRNLITELTKNSDKLAQKEILKTLLNAKIDLNEKTNSDETSMYNLIQYDVELASIALEHASKKKLELEIPELLISMAASRKGQDFLKQLFSYLNSSKSEGCLGCGRAIVEAVRAKVDENIDFLGSHLKNSQGLFKMNGEMRTPLTYAVNRLPYEEYETLLKRKFFDLDYLNLLEKSSFPISALHHAVSERDPKIVELLLKYGANPNNREKYGLAPLHIAADKGDRDIIRILLKYKADKNLKSELYFDWTPVFFAVYGEEMDALKILFENGANINLQDNDGDTLNHICKSSEIQAFLDKIKSPKNLKNSRGYLPQEGPRNSFYVRGL